MRYRSLVALLLVLLSLTSCGIQDTPLSLLSHRTTISTQEVNEALAKAFPIQKRSSFGTIAFYQTVLKPSEEGNRVALSITFVLTSFEIPEGIEGTLTLSAGLRYDPHSRKIYLKEITPAGVHFNDNTLSQYVSNGARSALNVIAMREFSDIEIYQAKESFYARFIKNITVSKRNIVIRYGL